MRVFNEELHTKKKREIMEKCFDCYAEYGFNNVGIKGLAKACGCTSGNLYVYFNDLDDLIVQSTEYCMSKVENDLMNFAPKNIDDLWTYIERVPYWTAINHGKKYRLMYQIYTNPKYKESGKRFFEGVNQRYTEYAKSLEPKLGLSYEVLLPFIFILIRASVHYALFEDEYYLKAQINVLKQSLKLFVENSKSQ